MIAHFGRCYYCSKSTSSYLLNRNNFLLNRTRNSLLSVAANIPSTSEAEKLSEKSFKKSRDKSTNPVWKHLSQWLKEEELNAIPNKHFCFQSQPPRVGYLIDKDTASHVREILDKEDFDIEGTVIEINAGLGLLTQHLIELGFKNIVCFEEDLHLATRLRTKYPSVSVINKKFLNLAGLVHLDKLDQSSLVESFLSEIPSLKNGKQVYIVGVTPSVDTLNFQTNSLSTGKVFYNEESCAVHPIYYYFLGPKPYALVSSSPKDGFYTYRSASILVQLLFEWELLGDFSSGGFFPWYAEKSTKKSKKEQRVDLHRNYLVKGQTNRELLKKVSQEELYTLTFFVKNNLISRASAVIPLLEKFIPDCGPRLIRKGLTIYTRFGELSPKQVLDLYLELKSWPEFKQSSFAAAAETQRSRFEIADQNVMTEEES